MRTLALTLAGMLAVLIMPALVIVFGPWMDLLR